MSVHGGAESEDTLHLLRTVLGERLGIDPAVLDPNERLHRYGLTSLTAASVVALLAERLKRALPATLLWDYPTLNRLAAYLDGRPDVDGRAPILPLAADEPIAIIGMACRLPGAPSLSDFWTLLRNGTDAITTVPPDRWPADALCDPDPQAPGRMATPWGGFIDGVDQFDAAFFGLSPREAAQADPQQRLALELAWEALEDAGIRPRGLTGSRTGVFIGAMWSDYARLLGDRDAIGQHTATGQDISIISARIAYMLGLEGPALTIDTACSSALVAVHQACRSLRAGESRLAFAGGVHLLLAPESSIAMTKFGAMAPDGRCKPFDARANGYVRGEGGGLVVLKPLRSAQADGDRIYAVIRGGAMNNDGPSNGLTAPNPAAQRGMLRDALAEARVDPLAVDYVEAHGTGTALGDPIEALALASVLCEGRAADRPLRIGSVKSNIGHLEAAAGVAGLIKLALSLRNRWIPPSLHYLSPNPAIDFVANRLLVQVNGAGWPDGATQPIAGVSSFGFGGTNCHVLLQAMPPEPAPATPGARPVFVFAGNGGNWAGMARDLLAEPLFAAEIAACDAELAKLGYPAPLVAVLDDARVTEVATGQPALCAFQLALAALLRGMGIEPAAVIGHSVGEVAAAGVAGVLTRAEVLRVVVARSRLQQTVAGQGGMALAAAPAEALSGLLPPEVVVAGENGPRATLLAGTREALRTAGAHLDRAGVVSQPIEVPVAYHSPQMDPLRPLLEQEVADLRPGPGAVPVVSTVTGAALDGAALGAAYWGRNLRDPVRFRQGIETLAAAGHSAFLELAPHPLLAAQIRQMAPAAVIASPLRRGQADPATLRAGVSPFAGVRRGVRPRHLLVLSARSEAALRKLGSAWAERLPADFADLCHTALIGRERFAWRLALHAADGEDARRRLLAGEFLTGQAGPEAKQAFEQRRRADESWEAWLDRCAAAFVAGADIDGAAFDADEPWRVISAPTYPFERERHWLPTADAGLSYALTWEAFEPASETAPWPKVRPEADPPDPALDTLATAFARAALATVPADAILPRHRGLAGRLAAWVRADGAAPIGPGSVGPSINADAADFDAGQAASSGQQTPTLALVRRAGRALPDLLTGKADPLEVLFPGGDLEAASAVYRAPPFAAAQRALARTLGAFGRPLRVLELGAGTGALTTELLAHLPEGSTLLCSDVSDAFLGVLRRRFPTVETALFDLDAPAAPARSPFDAIVGANVVHAGRRIGPILHALRGMLVPGGVLGLVELTSAPRWVDLVFGLTEGWWRYRGDPERPDHALLDARGWQRALAQAGFANAEIRPDGDCHAVILARVSGTVARWQVIGDASLADAVPNEPDPTARLYVPAQDEPASLVAALSKLAPGALPLTVVHDSGLAHAALAGAVRALMLDHPEAITAAVELRDNTEPTLRRLRHLLGRSGAEDMLRIEAGQVSVARLARVTPGATMPRFLPDQVYVIAGGFGRLGQACARFLIGRGARHLLLVSRAAGDPTPLVAGGADVRALSLDLTQPGSAAALHAAIDRPLGGIVHAAGLADGTADAVFAAKHGVADTLAAAAEGLKPGFLLLFSSAAGVWGTRGHVAYAAANRMLDSWAEQARARGMPATAIAFGRFQEPGLLRPGEDAALEEAGMRAMPTDDAFTAAFRAVAEGVASRIVASVDWPRFRATFEARRRRTLFDQLAARHAAAPAPAARPSEPPRRVQAGRLDQDAIAVLLADLLGHADARGIDRQRGLFEQGLDSLMAVTLRRRLEEAAGIPVPAAVLFSHPTVARLAEWLTGAAPNVPATHTRSATSEPVAIIGLACRFAGGADGPDAYLARLMAGADVIGPVPPSRPTAPLWQAAPDAVRRAGFLDGVEQFDAAFFGISPREAVQLDPQQRLLLEIAWQALEHAGIAPDRLNGSRTGVYVGATGSDYGTLARAGGLDAHSLVGQPTNTLAGRLSYHFGLHGPALTLDTACSSSLVALHLAVRALRAGEAELALAGGVNLFLTPDTSLMLARAGLLAPDGRCKVFDRTANGYVRGEGCGIVVLKPLARARADGDRVLAIVRGSAVNHDGRSSSFTAPNGAAQAAVVRDALADAAVAPETIDLVEAHGTGTALGDPVELDALADVFAGRDRALPVGSVKAAIGHAEAAAGIAGVIKTVMCLRAGALPPQPHFHTLNPHARPGSPVTVATGGPLDATLAGVSAFGASGTNAHIVLEAVREAPAMGGEGPPVLFLSARTETALERLRQDVRAAMAAGLEFADLCHTAWVGRARFGCWLLADCPDALATAPIRTGAAPALPAPRGRRIAFPPTPFERQPYWLSTRPSLPTDERAALGTPRRSARSGETMWETRLDPEAAWLRDHVVEGEVILPAAGFLDLMLAAGLGEVADIAFQRKLAVPAGGTAVQLLLDRAGEVTLYAEEPDGWAEIASARRVVHAADPEAVASKAFADHQGAVAPAGAARTSLDGPAIATEFAGRGFGFGPSYQMITRLTRIARTAWATLGQGHPLAVLAQDHALSSPEQDGRLDFSAGGRSSTPARNSPLPAQNREPAHPAESPQLVPTVRDQPLGPPLIDAAIQVLSALLPSSDRPWLPARIERVVPAPGAEAPAPRPWIARARLRTLDEHHAVGDAWLEHPDGTLALLLQGVELRAVRAEPGAWYHDVLWRSATATPEPARVRWHGIGPSAAALGCDSHDEAGTAPLPAVDGVIDLRPLSADSPARCIEQVAALVRAAAALPRPPQLVLVSRGASVAPPVLPGPVPAAAVLMGVQPVIAVEHPALRCRWVDLDPDEADIPATLHAPAGRQSLLGPAGRYALRQGRLLTPEIVKASPPPSGPVRLVAGPERSLADLRMVPLAEQAPGPGEVLIAVEATGLNFKDVLTVLGRVPARDDRLGLECAGTVVATGPGVVGLAPGDPVLGFGPGVLASRAILPANRVLPRPAWLDADTAASLPVACLTAWYGLHELALLRPGMKVLVHAGAGGVGSMAVRLARVAGALVFATASAGKQAAARKAGADAVGDSRSVAFAAPARRWAGPDGFDVVLNALGPEIADASAALLRPDGVFLEIGSAPRPPGVARWMRFDLDQPMSHNSGWFTDRMDRLLRLIRSGELTPPRRTVVPLAQVNEALQTLGQGRTVGKLVVRFPQPVPVRADGAYLVTGGTGAVGGALARWLMEAGAGRVLVVARTAGSGAGGDGSGGQLAQAGGTAGEATPWQTVNADVTDPAAMAALIGSLPNLRGVVHAAGVVRDGTIERLNQADIAAVLAPKAEAARTLDGLTRVQGVDFFTLVSSSAGSIAAPGQAAYAGANAWLDRLAATRRAAGFPAVSIGSGPWAAGMFARLDEAARARLQRDGFRPMAPHRAAAAFAQVMADGAVHRLVMDRTPLAAEPPDPPGGLGAGLLAVQPAQRRRMLEGELARKVVAVLGFAAGTRIDPARALRDLGLDSLLSVSLRNELAAGYGLDLPATLLFDQPTLAALASHLLELLEKSAAPSGDPRTQPAGPETVVPGRAAPPSGSEAHLTGAGAGLAGSDPRRSHPNAQAGDPDPHLLHGDDPDGGLAGLDEAALAALLEREL